jgi:hypothetical protein
MMSVLAFRGSHIEAADINGKSSMALELRRRSFWALFVTDKVFVSFTGRPPLLARHYVSTPLPLDLKDDYIFSDEDTFEHAVATKLDAEGWNIEDGFYCSTIVRTRAMISIIKDEVFEIALGPNALMVSAQRIVFVLVPPLALGNVLHE